MSDDVLLARAFLNRVAEPANIPLWDEVRRRGPVETVQAIRTGQIRAEVAAVTSARSAHADPYADLEAAERHGLRLVVPESDEWPHFAFAALEAAGRRRVDAYDLGRRTHSDSGELIPPLALWIRGSIDSIELATVGVRSVALVGSRAATDYGERVAKDLGYHLASRQVVVVSGGAYGIDAAAHRGALSAEHATVLVSAGGLDCPYPSGNSGLFERVAERGLLVSESPPGSAPQRHRFLTRNRLIAALGTGTVVIEAALRSGALNTAHHCVGLGRPLMAVPGPVSSGTSAGCHTLLAAEHDPARLVTCADDVLGVIGSSSDLPPAGDGRRSRGTELSDRLDLLDTSARHVFDGFPARRWVGPDRLAAVTGLAPTEIIAALPMLEVSGLIESSSEGYRIARAARPRAAAPQAAGERSRGP